VDETPRPTATPKTNAVAANAPSMIGDTPRCATDYRFATGGMLSIVISIASAKAEEGQDRQNYDDETGEINQPHSLKYQSIGKVPQFREKHMQYLKLCSIFRRVPHAALITRANGKKWYVPEGVGTDA
jgi:hypothetical protein